MDDKKNKEEAALAQIAREESESKAKMLIIPKRLVSELQCGLVYTCTSGLRAFLLNTRGA